MKTFNCVKKMSSGSVKHVNYKMCLDVIILTYVYKKNFALDKIQWLICHENKPN